MEGEEEENTWGCLARPKRPKGPAEPATKKTKGPPSRVYPDLPVALRRYAGGSGNRNFYDLRDKRRRRGVGVTSCFAPLSCPFIVSTLDAVFLANRSLRNIPDSSVNIPR